NVAFIFNEDLRREPDDDSLTIVKGQFSSYPNFVFKVSFDALPDFVEMLTGIRSQAGLVELVATYGVRRTAPDFWQVFDRVQVGLTAQDPLQAGLLDLNRYDDPKTEFSFQQLFDFGFLENQER
ncbi:peptidylprolyl isomerase, partial [Roseibium denhamense]